jgi:hypothetical protein
MSLLKDSLICGIMLAVIGVIFHIVSLKVYGPHDLNDTKIFAGHLLIVGVITHVVKELFLKDYISKL